MAVLGSLIEQVRGVSYKPEDLHTTLNENSITLLRANNIKDGQLNFDDVVYVDKKKVSDKQLLKAGDILICASSGSKELVGKAAYVECNLPMTFGAFCKVVRPKTDCPQYMGHFFNSPYYRDRIANSAAGANINNIRNEHVDVLEIAWPSVEGQRSAVAVLDKVSELIALRKEQLAKLDQLVKSRFIELFGDYRINEKGFDCKKGSELFKFSSGKFLPEEKRLDEGIPVYGGNGIAWYTSESLVDYPTIIIGRVGAQCGNVHAVTTPVWITDNAIYIKEQKTNAYTLEFLTELMRMMDFYQYADFSGQPKITQKPLETLNYIMPPIELQNEYTAFVEQTDKSKLAIQQSLDKLELLKKSLMQEYFG